MKYGAPIPVNFNIMQNKRELFLFNCFYHKGKYILFDGRTYAVVEIDKAMHARISKKTIKSFCNDSIDREISSLIDRSLISKRDFDDSTRPDFKRLVVLLTTACNLRCKYCFEGQRKPQHHATMSQQTAGRCVRYLMNHSPGKTVELHFFGGEPLLNFEIIKYFVKIGNRLADKYSKTIHYSIVTNGTKITNGLAAFFSRHKFCVQVSIDGCQTAHDANRTFPGGAGSYKLICQNIRHLNNNNVNYTALSVASRQLLKTDDTWFSNLKSITKGKFDFCFVADKRPAFKPAENQIRKCLSYYKKYLRIGTGHYDVAKHGILPVMKYQDAISNGYRRYLGCGAASEEITIMPNGDINLCQRLGCPTAHNIRDDVPPAKLWREYARSAKDKTCDSCWAKYLCGGGCKHTSLLFTNNEKPVWWECEKKKLEMETAIKVLYNSMIENGERRDSYDKGQQSTGCLGEKHRLDAT